MSAVQLPAVTVYSQQTGLQADLRTSLRFCGASSSIAEMTCIDDLQRLRKEQKLWIFPASACRMHFSVRLLSHVSDQHLDMKEVARWIESCDVWERLRLHVRHCEMPGGVVLEFSLQHPDLLASLSCPPTAAKAELQDLRCQIEITEPPGAQKLRKRKRSTAAGWREDAAYQPQSEASANGEAHSKYRSAMYGVAVGPTETAQRIPKKCFEIILQAAITVLITGSARHFTNISVGHGQTKHALVKLIPAVFSVPYIRTISERAQHTPTITSALTAMHNTAQSPSLRRKLWGLAHQGGIEKHLWYSTLSQLKLPTVPGPRMIVAGPANRGAVGNTETDYGLGSNTICFGEDLVSSNFQDDTNEDDEFSSTRETSSIVSIDYVALEGFLLYLEREPTEVPFCADDTRFSGGTRSIIEFGEAFSHLEQIFDI